MRRQIKANKFLPFLQHYVYKGWYHSVYLKPKHTVPLSTISVAMHIHVKSQKEIPFPYSQTCLGNVTIQ